MSESPRTHRTTRAGPGPAQQRGQSDLGRLVAEPDAVFANLKPGTPLTWVFPTMYCTPSTPIARGVGALGNFEAVEQPGWATGLVRAATVTRVWTSDEAQPDNLGIPSTTR